ncbi:MAG: DUF2007 domain-containing protein [Candidatus Hydrogenedentes bacterium]|nr:DUF2007 domain-containing protein [Candidatus Hydrogenedentota bacterium]
MFCPGCGAEYEPGITECAECHVALVAEAPDNEPHFQDTVNVFESDDPGEIALAESLLQGAEIPYVVQNATGQTLVGAVARESMFASVEVKPEHADAASELLADLNEGIPAEDIDEYYDDDDDDDDDFEDEEDGDEKFTEASEDE